MFSFSRAAAALAGLMLSAPALAQNRPADPPPSTLPVREVVVFTSGVAYVGRSGEVNGDATVPLTFRTGQINDILKSLVLIDEKGTVQPVIYNARDPIGRTLQAFAVDVTQPLSRAELLNRLRGARVSVETSNKETLTGQIVGVEVKNEMHGDQVIPIEILTILGDAGLQSARLSDVKAIRLLDERLNREFKEALGILASGADEQRRQVTLHFDGDGRRQVRVGYVTEAPLWKMSYRLLLGGKNAATTTGGAAADKPYLQGWALVENTTDDDWQNIRLSLVSGRPVSFIQDLYQPLYIPRPVVPLDVVASPYPQTHGGNLLGEAQEKAAQLDDAIAGVRREAPEGMPAPAAPSVNGAVNRNMRGAGGFGGGAGGRGLADSDAASLGLDNNLYLRQSVAAQAAGEKAGELFQYHITTPVTLPRQQAAMIPVIAQDIGATKVLLYNADASGRFPLDAVRVQNTTALHLKGGPVTLFDGGVYAGDARMEDIPPGDSRLVTYAVDLTVEGERQGPGMSSTETVLSLRRGVLIVTRRERIETTYTLKSKSEAAQAQPKAEETKTVLVEHPFQPEYKLVQPEKADERTASVYRFPVVVAPGKSETLKVIVERPISQTIGLLDMDLNALLVYARRTDIPAAVRDALQEVVARRRRVQELQAAAANRQSEIGAMMQDQERIRKNMGALDRNSALYKRYVAELDRQETRMQTLRTERERLLAQAAEADRDLRAYLDKLDIGG